jgi:hypothetical protein
MNDLNITSLTEKEIVRIIDDRLFSSLDGVVNLIDVSLVILTIGLTIFIVITGLKYKSMMEVTKKIKDEVLADINKKFNQESKMLEDEFHRKLTRNLRYNIKHHIKEYKDEAQREEFIRNIIFKHLSELLADEIKINGESNLKEVFNLYSDRLYLISQLTSNNEIEVKKALRKLSTGTYNKILRLQAFKEYLDILEKKIEIDVTIELYDVKKAMLTLSKN